MNPEAYNARIRFPGRKSLNNCSDEIRDSSSRLYLPRCAISQARRPSPAPGTKTRNSPLRRYDWIHMEIYTTTATFVISERESNIATEHLSSVCSTLLFLVLPRVNLGKDCCSPLVELAYSLQCSSLSQTALGYSWVCPCHFPTAWIWVDYRRHVYVDTVGTHSYAKRSVDGSGGLW